MKQILTVLAGMLLCSEITVVGANQGNNKSQKDEPKQEIADPMLGKWVLDTKFCSTSVLYNDANRTVKELDFDFNGYGSAVYENSADMMNWNYGDLRKTTLQIDGKSVPMAFKGKGVLMLYPQDKSGKKHPERWIQKTCIVARPTVKGLLKFSTEEMGNERDLSKDTAWDDALAQWIVENVTIPADRKDTTFRLRLVYNGAVGHVDEMDEDMSDPFYPVYNFFPKRDGAQQALPIFYRANVEISRNSNGQYVKRLGDHAITMSHNMKDLFGTWNRTKTTMSDDNGHSATRGKEGLYRKKYYNGFGNLFAMFQNGLSKGENFCVLMSDEKLREGSSVSPIRFMPDGTLQLTWVNPFGYKITEIWEKEKPGD
jgi:hypothetical protein